MHPPVWMMAALLFMVAGMAGSSASASAKPLQETEQRAPAASGKTEGPNPDASGKYHVGDGVSAPQVIYSVDAEFTDKARKKKLNGTCTVGLLVDATGM